MDPAFGGYYTDVLPLQYEVAPVQVGPRPRSQWAPLAFLLPLVLCGVSWAGGGVPSLTDLGFVFFTIVCSWFCVIELVKFPQRTGVGALMLYGGVVIWFCMDYLTYWAGTDFCTAPIPAHLIAKAAK